MSKPIFTSTTYVDDLGKTPASVNVRTGDLYINTPVFNKLKPLQKQFVLWHEHGHFSLKTRNEFEADNYAFEKMVNKNVSLKELVYSLSDVLSGENKQHYDRLIEQFNRAKKYDMDNNYTVGFGGEMKAKRQAKKAERQDKKAHKQAVKQERIDRRKDLKVQKKEDALQRKNDRQAATLNRKDRRLGLRETNKTIKAERISGRQTNIANRIAGNNYKKMTNADNGVSEGDNITKSIMGGVGGIVGGIFGKGGGDDGGGAVYDQRSAEAEEKEKNNKMMIIGAVVLVVLFAFMQMQKK